MGKTATKHGLRPPRTEGSALQNVRNDLNHGAPRRIFTDRIAKFARTVPPEADVIEIGAGVYDYGEFFPQLVRFDFDPAQNPDILGDAHDMPIADGSFDLVVANSVLEHVENAYRVVQECHRILRPGGRVFAWVPFFFGVHGFPGDIARFTEEGFRSMFEQAGFRVESSTVEPYSGLFHNLSNAIHFTLPRNHRRRSVRAANRALFLAARAGFPLDRRLKLRTLYAGTELIAVKD